MSSPPPLDPIALVLVTGEHFDADHYASVLALGDAAIPPLLTILGDDDLAVEDAAGGGWAPVHAVTLLTDLKAEAAIAPMLQILEEGDPDSVLYDRVLLDLHKIGAPVLEPALAAMDLTTDEYTRHALCFVLAELGIRDERIFAKLVRLFEEDAALGSMCLGDYGDERALPLLGDAIMSFVPDWTHREGVRDFIEYVTAYERITDVMLPSPLRERSESIRLEWQRRWDDRGMARSTKVGRNDPCPCGSGKKYKKCCEGKPVAT